MVNKYLFKEFNLIGGGKCSICGSENTTKATCPLNPNAKNPNPKKHYLANARNLPKPKTKPKPILDKVTIKTTSFLDDLKKSTPVSTDTQVKSFS